MFNVRNYCVGWCWCGRLFALWDVENWNRTSFTWDQWRHWNVWWRHDPHLPDCSRSALTAHSHALSLTRLSPYASNLIHDEKNSLPGVITIFRLISKTLQKTFLLVLVLRVLSIDYEH